MAGVDLSFLNTDEGTTSELLGENSDRNLRAYVVSDEITDQQEADQQVSEIANLVE